MTMKVRHFKRFLLWLPFGILLLLAGLLPMLSVVAQSETTLAVDPVTSQVPLGNTITLQAAVTGGVNVNAFDVTVLYDSDRLTLMSWEYGDYLSNLGVVKKVDQPGFFRIAATQLAQPAVSGDGALLTMTFMGIGEGSSDIVIVEAIFADSTGHKTYPATQNGLLTVVQEQSPSSTPTSTATRTVTPTATLTATQTRTLTPTVTSTSTPSATLTPTATPTRSATRAPNGSPTRTVTATSASGSNGPPPADTQTGPTPEPVSSEEQALAGEEAASQDEPTPEADGNNFVVENIKKITENAKTREERLNRLVWAFLIGALLLEGILFFALIRRSRKRKDDDYLL